MPITLTRRGFGRSLAGSALVGAGSPLFPGERLIEAGGFPSLVRFFRGDPAKPLVMFLPGTSFLARIAYGYPGGNDEDFLATWLVRRGFSFLGASYPLDSPVYPRVFPTFGIADWGRQAAIVARGAIEAAGLGSRMIAVGWSMGGKPAVQLARSARAVGLDVSLFVALDALPPGAHLFPGNAAGLRLAPDGLVDQASTLMPWFEAMLDVQNRIAGHIIIPPALLRTAFTGNPPLDIQGENVRFRAGRMVSDPAAAAADSASDDYGSYPPLALIVSDSAADYPNVLLCRSNWSQALGQELYRSLVFPRRAGIKALSPARWAALQSAIVGATERLTIQVPGTHFLFVGAPGAARTAAAIETLAVRSSALRREIAATLS